MTKAHELYEFIWMTRPLVQQVEEAVERGLAGTGLTVRMRAVLELLARDGSQPVPDLARKLHIQRQYVQVMVNEALEAGFVERMPNPRHARSPLIVLTRYGGELIEEVLNAEMDTVDEIAARLQPEDIDTALSVAQHVFSRFRQLNEGQN